MKSLEFVGSSRLDLKTFPDAARQKAGFELNAVQHGERPSDWKPMPTVGKGVYEIRIHHQGEFRVIYAARFEDKVYVLHAFLKKTQKTRLTDIALATARYKEIGGLT